MVTMAHCLSDWRGTTLAHTGDSPDCNNPIIIDHHHISERVMAEEEPMEPDKGLSRREVGLTTPTWTRPGLCCGHSSSNMAPV